MAEYFAEPHFPTIEYSLVYAHEIITSIQHSLVHTLEVNSRILNLNICRRKPFEVDLITIFK